MYLQQNPKNKSCLTLHGSIYSINHQNFETLEDSDKIPHA